MEMIHKKKEIAKHMKKKHKLISVPSQRYQDSRQLLQNTTFPNYVMGFSNRTQRFTGSNYLDVDSPLKGLSWTKIFLYGWTLLKSVCAVKFSEKPSFWESVYFQNEMFLVTNFGLVLRICIVNARIFIKKNYKLVQDQFLQILKDH